MWFKGGKGTGGDPIEGILHPFSAVDCEMIAVSRAWRLLDVRRVAGARAGVEGHQRRAYVLFKIKHRLSSAGGALK